MEKTDHLYVTYDMAMLLREYGFKDTCFGRYDIFSKELHERNYATEQTDFYALAPLYGQAVDWLRREQRIWVTENFWDGDDSWNVVQQTKEEEFSSEASRVPFIKAIEIALDIVKDKKQRTKDIWK